MESAQQIRCQKEREGKRERDRERVVETHESSRGEVRLKNQERIEVVEMMMGLPVLSGWSCREWNVQLACSLVRSRSRANSQSGRSQDVHMQTTSYRTSIIYRYQSTSPCPLAGRMCRAVLHSLAVVAAIRRFHGSHSGSQHVDVDHGRGQNCSGGECMGTSTHVQLHPCPATPLAQIGRCG